MEDSFRFNHRQLFSPDLEIASTPEDLLFPSDIDSDCEIQARQRQRTLNSRSCHGGCNSRQLSCSIQSFTAFDTSFMDDDDIPTRDAGLDLSFSNNRRKSFSPQNISGRSANKTFCQQKDLDQFASRRFSRQNDSDRSINRSFWQQNDFDGEGSPYALDNIEQDRRSVSKRRKAKTKRRREMEKSRNNNSLNFQEKLEQLENGEFDEEEMNPEDCGDLSIDRRPSTWEQSGGSPSELFVTTQNVDSLLISARFYNQDQVIGLCKDLLINCNVQDALYYRFVAEKHDLMDVLPSLIDFVRSKFTSIVQTHSFLGLGLRQLRLLLSDDGLKVQGELDVFHAARAWIDHSKHNRIKQVGEVMACVRFIHISPEDIVRHVEPHKNYFRGPGGREVLLTIYRYHALHGSQSDLSAMQLDLPPPRCYVPLSESRTAIITNQAMSPEFSPAEASTFSRGLTLNSTDPAIFYPRSASQISALSRNRTDAAAFHPPSSSRISFARSMAPSTAPTSAVQTFRHTPTETSGMISFNQDHGAISAQDQHSVYDQNVENNVTFQQKLKEAERRVSSLVPPTDEKPNIVVSTWQSELPAQMDSRSSRSINKDKSKHEQHDAISEIGAGGVSRTTHVSEVQNMISGVQQPNAQSQSTSSMLSSSNIRQISPSDQGIRLRPFSQSQDTSSMLSSSNIRQMSPSDQGIRSRPFSQSQDTVGTEPEIYVLPATPEVDRPPRTQSTRKVNNQIMNTPGSFTDMKMTQRESNIYNMPIASVSQQNYADPKQSLETDGRPIPGTHTSRHSYLSRTESEKSKQQSHGNSATSQTRMPIGSLSNQVRQQSFSGAHVQTSEQREPASYVTTHWDTSKDPPNNLQNRDSQLQQLSQSSQCVSGNENEVFQRINTPSALSQQYHGSVSQQQLSQQHSRSVSASQIASQAKTVPSQLAQTQQQSQQYRGSMATTQIAPEAKDVPSQSAQPKQQSQQHLGSVTSSQTASQDNQLQFQQHRGSMATSHTVSHLKDVPSQSSQTLFQQHRRPTATSQMASHVKDVPLQVSQPQQQSQQHIGSMATSPKALQDNQQQFQHHRGSMPPSQIASQAKDAPSQLSQPRQQSQQHRGSMPPSQIPSQVKGAPSQSSQPLSQQHRGSLAAPHVAPRDNQRRVQQHRESMATPQIASRGKGVPPQLSQPQRLSQQHRGSMAASQRASQDNQQQLQYRGSIPASQMVAKIDDMSSQEFCTQQQHSQQRSGSIPSSQSLVKERRRSFEALQTQHTTKQSLKKGYPKKQTFHPKNASGQQMTAEKTINQLPPAQTNLTVAISDMKNYCSCHCCCHPELKNLLTTYDETTVCEHAQDTTRGLSEKQLNELEERIKQRRKEIENKTPHETFREKNIQFEPCQSDPSEMHSVTSVRIEYCKTPQRSPLQSPKKTKMTDRNKMKQEISKEKTADDRNTSHSYQAERQPSHDQDGNSLRKSFMFRPSAENTLHAHLASFREPTSVKNIHLQQKQQNQQHQNQQKQQQNEQQLQQQQQQQQQQRKQLQQAQQRQQQQHEQSLYSRQPDNIGQHYTGRKSCDSEQPCQQSQLSKQQVSQQTQQCDEQQSYNNAQQEQNSLRGDEQLTSLHSSHGTSAQELFVCKGRNFSHHDFKLDTHLSHSPNRPDQQPYDQHFANCVNNPTVQQRQTFNMQQSPEKQRQTASQQQRPLLQSSDHKTLKPGHINGTVKKQVLAQAARSHRRGCSVLRRHRSQSPDEVSAACTRRKPSPRHSSQTPRDCAVFGISQYYNDNAQHNEPENVDDILPGDHYRGEPTGLHYQPIETDDQPQDNNNGDDPAQQGTAASGLIYRYHPYITHDTRRLSMEPGDALIIAVGGLNPKMVHPEIPCRLMDMYDPNTNNTCGLLGKLPEGRHHHGCVMLDGYLYVIGGSLVLEDDLSNMCMATNSCYRYDFGGNFWTEIAPMHSARMYHSVAVLEGVIYTMGGETSHGVTEKEGAGDEETEDEAQYFLDSCEYYNPDTDQWGPIANMMDATIGAAVIGFRGRVWVLGGFLQQGKERVVLSAVECYDPRTNSWFSMNPLPVPVCHSSVAEVMDTLFLVGGANVLGWQLPVCSLGDVLQYQEEEDIWMQYSTLSVPRHDASCCVVDTRLYVLGGICSITKEVLQKVECIDVTSGSWLEYLEPLSSPALGLACVSITPEDFD